MTLDERISYLEETADKIQDRLNHIEKKMKDLIPQVNSLEVDVSDAQIKQKLITERINLIVNYSGRK